MKNILFIIMFIFSFSSLSCDLSSSNEDKSIKNWIGIILIFLNLLQKVNVL